jgi:hypothetical protein
MIGNLASLPIKSNFLPITHRPPLKNIFPESKNVSEKCWRLQGGGRRFFLEIFHKIPY